MTTSLAELEDEEDALVLADQIVSAERWMVMPPTVGAVALGSAAYFILESWLQLGLGPTILAAALLGTAARWLGSRALQRSMAQDGVADDIVRSILARADELGKRGAGGHKGRKALIREATLELYRSAQSSPGGSVE
jgi:hypothetical protein